MIKFIPAFTNRKDIDRDECRARYAAGHGELAATAHEFNRHLPKYVQNFVLDDLSALTGRTPKITGVSEDWFYSVAGFWDAFAEPRYADFREDECRFLDIEDLILVFADASFVYGVGADAPLKFFRFLFRAPDVPIDQFRKAWEVDYAAMIARDPMVRAVTRSYVQNRPIQGVDHSFPISAECDAVDEFWFDDRDGVMRFLESQREVARQSGLDALCNHDATQEVFTRAKLLWDFGEPPKSALPRVLPRSQALDPAARCA